MPCRIEIKNNLETDVKNQSERALGMSLKLAQAEARRINKLYGTDVVEFRMEGDFLDRSIVIPESLVDKYYNHELDLESKSRNDADYKQLSLFQLEQVPTSSSSPALIAKMKTLAVKMGVDLQKLSDYLRSNPDINAKGVNALADLMRGVIAVAEGKEETALTEEMVHVATAILEQTNPTLVTEMISKIDRFRIYKQVLEAYRDRYKTPDRKPDIRKIKKEAVDKLITELLINQNDGTTDFPELMEETNRSMIRNWWNTILDWIRGMYRKSNISIFEEVARKISEGGVEGNVKELSTGEIYLQVSDEQKKIQQRIADTQATVLKRTMEEEKVDPILQDTEEASNWYEIKKPDGTFERVKRRVTDRVKAWYKKRFPGKTFTAEEKAFNEFKRVKGILGHSYFQEIHGRYFNSDGTRRDAVTPRSVILSPRDEAIYEKIENYFVELVERFSKDGKNPLVFSEVVVYDKKEKEAGTIDLLIVEEDGKANIFDWKFMSVAKGARDVAWYKQGAYNIQLGRYKEILIGNYGIKRIGMNRAIPVLMNIERENTLKKDSPMVLKGIAVGSADTSKIEDLRLVPVSEESETTGHENLDELIHLLNAAYRQIGKKRATSDEEREFKSKRLSLIKEAVRSAQGTENIAPLIEVIKEMRVEGQMILNDYNTIYKEKSASDADLTDRQLSDFSERMREYNAMSTVFGRVDDLIGNLVYSEEMEDEGMDEEEVQMRKETLDNIEKEARLIRESSRQIEKISNEFADKFIGIRNLVTGLLKPEAVIKGLSGMFRGVSELPTASLRLLFRMVENANSIAAQTALEEVNELLGIRKRLVERGGDLRKLIQRIYQKDDKGGLVNKLIYRYDKKFYEEVNSNAVEGQQDKQWLYDNIDVDAYMEEATKRMNENIEYYQIKYKDNEELMNSLILDEKRKWDITRKDFTGWNNYIIKRHPKEKWYSKEYTELKEDADLIALYEFISKINKKADDAGYLQSKGASTFLPFIRKSMAESLAWDFSLSAVSNWSKSFSVRADDVGYGAIDELTGELEYSIPKYYTQDFTRTEEGGHDYSDVSEDLFKNIILYINHMEKYKNLSDIEGQLRHIKTIEEFKGHLDTSRSGELILEDGRPKPFGRENSNNAKIFDDFLRALLYEQKYPLSSGDIPLEIGKLINFMKIAINNVVGKEVFKPNENPSVTSVIKVMDAANRWYQVKTLGLEAISGAVNAFGGDIQVATQAGNYFKSKEYFINKTKLIGNKFKHDEEREMFVQLVDKFMPLKDDPTYDKLKEAGMTALTRHNFIDMLMMFMRDPEQHLEKTIFLTLLQNMMIEDGHIVSIREYVKAKHPERYSSPEAYKESKQQIEEEIEELKRTRSMDAIKKLENGKLVIPGLDLNNTRELQRLTNLTRRISRNATGAMSNSDMNRMSMNIWTRSMMVFKNWIPKLVDTRFSEFRRVSDDFSVIVDDEGHSMGEKYDIGRIRLLMYVWGTSIRDKTSNIYNILYLNEKGINTLDKMYEDFAEKYRLRTGQEMNLTREEFIDMIRTNLSNQVKELAMLLSLVGAAFSLGFMVPDEEDDRASKNFFRWSQRVVDKFIQELSFFYNPAEFQRMLSGSAFPAIGVFKDIENFATHLTMQLTGYDISNPKLTLDEVREKAQPIKYAAKSLPFTKSLITYFSMFDSDFAKEFDITIQRQSNR